MNKAAEVTDTIPDLFYTGDFKDIYYTKIVENIFHIAFSCWSNFSSDLLDCKRTRNGCDDICGTSEWTPTFWATMSLQIAGDQGESFLNYKLLLVTSL